MICLRTACLTMAGKSKLSGGSENGPRRHDGVNFAVPEAIGSAGTATKPLAARDEAAVCGQVWVEFIGGFRRRLRHEHYAQEMRGYRWLQTPRAAFELAAQWLAR